MKSKLAMLSSFSFALVNTYTNAAGETVTEHMNPDYRSLMGPNDSPKDSPDGDFKPWSEGEEGPVFSRNLASSETSEVECELLLDNLELGREGSPEFENGEVLGCEVSDREVTPEHEGEQLSGGTAEKRRRTLNGDNWTGGLMKYHQGMRGDSRVSVPVEE